MFPMAESHHKCPGDSQRALACVLEKQHSKGERQERAKGGSHWAEHTGGDGHPPDCWPLLHSGLTSPIWSLAFELISTLFSCLPRELPCSEMACSREKITNQSLVPAGFPIITRKEEEKIPFSLGYWAGGKCGTCSLLLRGCRYHQLPHPLRVNPGDVGPRERRTLPLLEVPFLLQSLLGKICPYP